MRFAFHLWAPFFLLFLLFSCASGGKKLREKLRSNYNQGALQALEFLENSKLAKDKSLRLLYLLEKGKFLADLGAFEEATLSFQKAKNLSDKWFTKSLSERVATFVLNENYERYHGEIYEHSALHYLMAYTFYQLYQEGRTRRYSQEEKQLGDWSKISRQEKNSALQRARAVVVSWNAFFETVQRDRNTLYRADLMMAVLGAKIHLAIGGRQEKEIAYKLLQKAKVIYRKIGLSLPSFNESFDDFGTQLLENQGRVSKKMKQAALKKTKLAVQLENYLEAHFRRLQKELRPKSFRKWKKSASLEEKRRVRSAKNTSLVFEEGLIRMKEAKEINIGIAGAMNAVDDPAAKKTINIVGTAALMGFANQVLGLNPSNSAGQLFLSRAAAEVGKSEAAIRFEIPHINLESRQESYSFAICPRGESNPIKEGKLTLLQPLSDAAALAVSEAARVRILKAGGRVALKHVLAIVAAYGTYRGLRGKDAKGGESFLAKAAAVATYLASSRLIKESEKADVRQWISLPDAVHVADLNLSAGKYSVSVSYGKKRTPAQNARDLGCAQAPILKHFAIEKNENAIIRLRKI